ncbi:hypothetical protein Hte_002279 [Hypoxylon texense]
MQAAGVRQQPGFACEECRRRKARCDRVRPRCGVCMEFDVACITVTKRPRRGPKKGQIDMMRSRIGGWVNLPELQWHSGSRGMIQPELSTLTRCVTPATLEWELRKQSGAKEPNPPSPTSDVPLAEVSLAELSEALAARPEQPCPDLDIGIFPDGITDQATGLTQQCLAWPMEMTMSEAAGAVVATGRLDRDNNLPTPGQLSTVFEEQPELGDASSVMGSRDPEVSGWIRADLDDVYFDRVHKICPMVHQQRYFAWASQENPSRARACLRSAMRTLAASMSAPYWNCVNALYAESRRLLEELRRANDTTSKHSLVPCNKIQIEYVQAWLLLAHYESLRVNEWQAMITAGYAFRLVQMARLHELDKLQAPPIAGFELNENFSETEERRRTFWVAYTLDYFLCWRSEWPLTLYEDMVSTRLPAPEVNFQNSQPIITDHLADALAKGERSVSSLFSECIILATLHSRCVACHRTSSRDSSQEPARGARGHHESLAAAVERRVKLLGQNPTMANVERDPMLFFIHMLAHSAIICLRGSGGGAHKTPPWQGMENTQVQAHLARPYEQRAPRAVAEMLRLVKTLPSFSCFKAHPFLPNPLASGIAFLNEQGSPGEDAQAGAEALLQVLRDLCDVNNIAREICLAHDIIPWH